MENIIVTGGFGFIGLNLMSFLTNKKNILFTILIITLLVIHIMILFCQKIKKISLTTIKKI